MIKLTVKGLAKYIAGSPSNAAPHLAGFQIPDRG